MKPKIIIWALALMIAISLATAVGISPAKTTLEFTGPATLQKQFWVVNNEHQEFTMKLRVEGMSNYVVLKTEDLHFKEDDEVQAVDFEINLPSSVPPGTSYANIILEQELENLEEDSIASKMVLKHKIVIIGSYPEKYITTSINFREQGNQIKMVSEVQNLGQQDLQTVKTKFYVNDKLLQQQVLETEEIALKTKENKVLSTEIDKSIFGRGEFEVLAVTSYDDQTMEISKKLIVGQPEIAIAYFDKYFVAHKINKYSLDLLNKWNQKIKNIYVDIMVQKDGQTVDQFRTKSVDIDAQALKRINDYVDARNKNPGRYTFEMEVNFWNIYRMDKQNFQSELLTQDEFDKLAQNSAVGAAVFAPDLSDYPDASPAGSSSGNLLLIIGWMLLGILVGIIGFYILWRYFHRDQYEE